MDIRISVKQLRTGQWAAFTGERYYPSTVRDTERDSRVARLEEIGREAQDRIDAVDRLLEYAGASKATRDKFDKACERVSDARYAWISEDEEAQRRGES